MTKHANCSCSIDPTDADFAAWRRYLTRQPAQRTTPLTVGNPIAIRATWTSIGWSCARDVLGAKMDADFWGERATTWGNALR
jgi:hypothetical protein